MKRGVSIILKSLNTDYKINCSLGECLTKKNFITDTFKFVHKLNKKVKGFNLDLDHLGTLVQYVKRRFKFDNSEVDLP